MDNGHGEAGFLGVSEETLLALGQVSVAAAQLEWHARSLLVVLGGEPRGQFDRVAKGLRRRIIRLSDGLGVPPDPLLEWLTESRAAMDERGKLSHSSPVHVMGEDGWRQARFHLREQEVLDFDAAEVSDLAGRLAELGGQALLIWTGLQDLLAGRPHRLGNLVEEQRKQRSNGPAGS